MKELTRNLIKYNVDECRNIKTNNFKEITIDFLVDVPCQKPDILYISKVWIKPTILNKKLVETKVGTSLDGQTITGCGIILEGDLNVKIEYTADGDKQSSHIIQESIPYSGYIILPKDFSRGTVTVENVLIEDINSSFLNTRCIYNNVTLMLIADIC